MFGALNRLIGRQARRPDARLLALTLNNMTQGVVLFDTNGRLIVCNEQYRTMYELSPDVVKPGAALIDIIRNRISSGSLSRGAEEYCEEIMSQIAAGKTLSLSTRRLTGARYPSSIGRYPARFIGWAPTTTLPNAV